MTSRRARIGALVGLTLLVVGISVVYFLGSRDACMSGSDRGSCPALADVNGVRYEVSVAHPLIDIDSDLTPFAPISRTNVSGYFSELTTFQIRGFDPTDVLVAPARTALEEDVGPFRLLFGPNSGRAYPALCDYIPIEFRLGNERCGAPA